MPTAADDLGVDHRRFRIPIAEQLLDRPDMVPLRGQVGGEGVAERVTARC
jgi:hypothetical protein